MKSLSRLKAHRLLLSVVIERDPIEINLVRSCSISRLVLTLRATDVSGCEVLSQCCDLHVEVLQPGALCYKGDCDTWVESCEDLGEACRDQNQQTSRRKSTVVGKFALRRTA